MKVRFPNVPGCLIFLLALIVPAVPVAYVLHNPAWLVAVPIAIVGLIFGLIFALALILGVLQILFGIGRRKGTPEEFADALEKHLLGDDPEPGWDDLMDVELADPRLAQVQQQICLHLDNFDTLASEEDKVKLRTIIAALRRGDLPDVPPQRAIASLFRFRK